MAKTIIVKMLMRLNTALTSAIAPTKEAAQYMRLKSQINLPLVKNIQTSLPTYAQATIEPSPKVRARNITIQLPRVPNMVAKADIVNGVLVNPLSQTPVTTIHKQRVKANMVVKNALSIDIMASFTGALLLVAPYIIAVVPRPASDANATLVMPVASACCTVKPMSPPATDKGVNALVMINFKAGRIAAHFTISIVNVDKIKRPTLTGTIFSDALSMR